MLKGIQKQKYNVVHVKLMSYPHVTSIKNSYKRSEWRNKQAKKED